MDEEKSENQEERVPTHPNYEDFRRALTFIGLLDKQLQLLMTQFVAMRDLLRGSGVLDEQDFDRAIAGERARKMVDFTLSPEQDAALEDLRSLLREHLGWS